MTSRPQNYFSARRLGPAASLLAAMFTTGTPSAFAVNAAWNTDAATGNFGDSNWTSGVTAGAAGGTYAAVTGDALYFDTSVTTTLTNTLSGASFAGFTFNAGSSAYTIGGNDLTLTGNLANSGTNLQTINANIATTAVRTVTLTTGGGNVTLGGVVSGTGGGLTTAGAGTLTLNGANTYTGATTIGAGTTIKVGNSSALGATAGALTLSGSASNLDLNGFSVTKGTYTASATGTTVGNTSGTKSVFTLGTGNAAITNLSNTVFSGNVELALIGTGTRTNTSSANTHTGGLTLSNNGATETTSPGWRISNGAFLGTGALTFGGNGGFTINSSGISNWNGFSNNVVVNSTGNHWNYQAPVTSSGTWTGSGSLSISNGFTPTFSFAGNMTSFQGNLILIQASNTFQFNNTSNVGAGSTTLTQRSSGTGTGVIQWNGTGNQTFAIGDLNTSGNSGTGALTLRNQGGANTTITFQVGSLNQTSTYSGNVTNGTGTNQVSTINKVGSGTWTLTGANTYTGATTVDAGTLLVNGSLTSAVTVNAGTFGGSGSSTQAVTIGNSTGTSDSFFAAGNAGVGTFTTTGAVTMNSDAVFSVQFNSDSSSFDKIVASGLTLNASSSLVLADLGTTTLGLSQSFTIFDNTGASSISGTFLGLAEGASITVGSNTFAISYLGGTGNDITLTTISAVPEPSTYAALAGVGVLALAAWRRRRAA